MEGRSPADERRWAQLEAQRTRLIAELLEARSHKVELCKLEKQARVQQASADVLLVLDYLLSVNAVKCQQLELALRTVIQAMGFT